MIKPAKIIPIKKCPLGVPGFGLITDGGAPEGRTTLVAGAAASGKTVLARQFPAGGARLYDDPGAMVTFEENPGEMFTNAASLGWDSFRNPDPCVCSREGAY